MKKKALFLSVIGLALAGAGAYGFWHYTESSALVAAARASIPPRPVLSAFPAELAQRVSAAESSVRNDPDPKDGLVSLALLYHANGFVEEAITVYKALIRLDAREARWSHNLAHIVAGYGQSEQAVALWTHALSLAPEYVPVHIRLGDALLKLDRREEAEKAYASGLDYAPRDPYLLVGLARIAILRKDWMTARARLEAATEASGFRIGNDLLVTVYEELGLHTKAEEVRGQAKSFGTFFDSPDPWFDAVQEDGYDGYYLALAAGTADRRGDRAAAFRLLNRAVRFHPTYALAHHHLGDLFNKAGNAAEAEKYLRRAVELDPSYGDSWILLFTVVGKSKGQAAALAVLREGLQRCPDSPGLHFENGRWLAQQKRYDEALKSFRLSASMRPAEVEALIEITRIHLQRQEVDEALALLERILEIMPGHPFALTTLAFHAIQIKDESLAKERMVACRRQPRIDRQMLSDLAGMYQQQFGRSPW